MKKLFILAITLTLYLSIFSQSPNKFSYQAVIRNASGQLVANSSISVRISILQESIDGLSIYSETHSALTNINGLVTILIGEGETSDSFSLIDWSNGLYFIKTETDIEGGDNFDIVGVSQLLSVPYALHANISDSLKGGIKEVDPNFNNSIASRINATDTINWNNKLDSINGNESAFKDWDKNASDDFNGDYNSLINAPNLSDTAVFLKSETDPAFKTSIASKITASDTTRWNNKLDTINGNESAFKDWDKNESDDFNGDYNSLINTPNLSDTVIYLKSESDPVFKTSLASKITSSDTTRWNTKSDFSGYYNDLKNLPSWNDSIKANIPDFSNYDNDATDDFSGSYLDLTNTPNWSDTIDTHVPDLSGFDKDDKNEIQVFSVSLTGDTLYLSSSNFIIIPGISLANHAQVSETTLTDIDGNVYEYVEIGTQTWMSENLKVTQLNDGRAINVVENNNDWPSSVEARYCWYNNEISNKDLYGAIYNLYTVNSGKVCPTGWHVPSSSEWDALDSYLNENGYASNEGSSLKSTSGWYNNGNGTNNFDFTAVPSGFREPLNGFYNLEQNCYFWTTTVGDATWFNKVKILSYDKDVIEEMDFSEIFGASIRCIKD